MGNLVSDRIGIDSDPELIRRQVLLDRERQLAAISNPQQQLAARLGGLLGGGIANIAQDRGFFEINDPLLNKVSKIQSVYNDVASRIDPASNPQEFFKELSAAYTNAGLGKEALKAAQEAQKASTLNMETQLKEAQLYSTRPELLSQRIEDALKAGNEAEAMRLAQMNQRILEGKDLEKRKTEADIKRIESQTREVQERIASGKFDWKIINNAAGAPIGVQVIDKKTGKLSFEKVDPDVTKAFLDSLGGGSTTPSTKDNKERPPLSSFQAGGGQPSAPVTPSATTQQTTWSGVPINPPPAAPVTAERQRDILLQQAFPTIPVFNLTEEAKQQMYLNLLSMRGQ